MYTRDSGDSICARYPRCHMVQFGINVTDFPVAERGERKRRSQAPWHLQLTDKICSSPNGSRRTAGRDTSRGFNVIPILHSPASPRLDEKTLPSSLRLLYTGRFVLLPSSVIWRKICYKRLRSDFFYTSFFYTFFYSSRSWYAFR